MIPIELTIKGNYVKQYRQNYPLISKEAVANIEVLRDEGSIVHLVEPNGKFIAKGFYGKQNKGLGWILTNKEKDTIDYTFFKSKLLKAMRKRESFFENENTNAFRIFNGEGDGIGGITIDYYDGYYVIDWYSEGAYTFKDFIIRFLDEVANYKGIYEKKRFNLKGKYIDDDDFVKGERGAFPHIIKENGIHYAVYLNDGAMVGIFLDQRDVRNAIRHKYANGKSVLNTFSYTGAFSVAAALGGARKTTSVDLAKRSKSKTLEQFSLNEIDVDAQDIIVMDVFDYFQYANRKGLTYDLVILDPPSFARSKKRTFSAAKDYPNLMRDAISVTNKGGIIVASTNNASFNMNKFKGFIKKGFQDARATYTILEEFSLPTDFRIDKRYLEGKYLKVVILKKTS